MTAGCDAEHKVLVFSVAVNGYGWAWRSCIRSHGKYAAHWGFDYACVDLPWSITPTEAGWLKIPLIIRALELGCYSWVLFLDADARIRVDSPDFRCVETPNCDVYMAHGHSSRLNSGVIMVRQSEKSLRFFREIVSDCETTVSAEDAAPYENGHVIKHGKTNSLVGFVERQWNNTVDPNLDDYVRHFTGPMAAQATVSRQARTRWQRAGKIRNRIMSIWTPALPERSLPARLELITEAVVSRYKVFRPT